MPAICAAPEGILHSGPGTTVDGTAALDGMHVSSGQLLRTSSGRFSELLLRKSSLQLLGDTTLQFNGDSAELVAGGVLLNTSARFPVQSGCADVAPIMETSARYLVQVQAKVVYVTAQEGDVRVHSRKEVRVKAGKSVAVYCATPAQNIVFLGADTLPKAIMAGAAAASPAILFPRSKQDMSATSPSRP